jgi:hypothetical protein
LVTRFPVAARIPRLSTTFRRHLAKLGVRPTSVAYRAVFAAVGALALFPPSRAFVRRMTGHNLWLLYRFDAEHVFVMTARNQPPIPVDD